MNQNQQDRSAFGGGNQPRYDVPKSSIGDQATGLNSFVLIGKGTDGKTQVWSSERDEQATARLVKDAMPTLAGLEHAT